MTEAIQVPIAEIITAIDNDVISRIFQAPIKNGKTTLRLVLAKNEIDEIVEAFNEARQNIIRAYAVPLDDRGNIIDGEEAEPSRWALWKLDDDGNPITNKKENEEGEMVEEKVVDSEIAASVNTEVGNLLEDTVEFKRYLRETDLDEINDALSEPLNASQVGITAWLWEDLRDLYDNGESQ